MERMPALTGLRFVAAAGVVGVHCDYWFHITGPTHAVLRNGDLGVTFFFVLSGFLLTIGYRPGRVRDFYRRRVARVYPLHLVTWTFAFAAFPVVGAGWEYLSGLGVLNGIYSVTITPQLNDPAWSLTCEAFFYAMFPWLVLRLPNTEAALRRALAACLFGIALTDLLAYLSLPSWGLMATRLPPFRVGEFVAGMILARLVALGWRPSTRLAWSTALLAVVACLTFPPAQPPRGLAILPALLVLVAWAARAPRSWLASRVMVKLGEQSYALFLSHLIVLTVLAPHAAPALLVLIPVWLGVAAVLHEAVERPAERWLRGGSHSPKRQLYAVQPA